MKPLKNLFWMEFKPFPSETWKDSKAQFNHTWSGLYKPLWRIYETLEPRVSKRWLMG